MAVKTWGNYIFQMPKGSYSIVSDGIWHVLVTFKNEADQEGLL